MRLIAPWRSAIIRRVKRVKSTIIAREPIIVTLLVAALVVCGLCACSRNGTSGSPPNIILVTMDTMRGDHLSCYDYARPTSPRIDEFAKTSTFYTRPMASAPWTVPTHASLFTGKDPFEHGSHTLKATAENIQDVRVLHDRHLTLAEALAQEGYTKG